MNNPPDAAIISSGNFTVSGATVINLNGYGFTVGQQLMLVDCQRHAAGKSRIISAWESCLSSVTASLSNNVANTSIDVVITSVGLSSWIPLVNSDAFGTSSFNSAGNWLNFTAPSAGNGYFTRAFILRSPGDSNPYTFAGDALSVDVGGQLLLKGSNGQTITVPNLILNGGLVRLRGLDDRQLHGNLDGRYDAATRHDQHHGGQRSLGAAETLNVTAPISGGGNLQINGVGGNIGVIELGANNTYTGTTTVAGGMLLVNGRTATRPSPLTRMPRWVASAASAVWSPCRSAEPSRPAFLPVAR